MGALLANSQAAKEPVAAIGRGSRTAVSRWDRLHLAESIPPPPSLHPT